MAHIHVPRPDVVDWEEATHRREELALLLAEMPDAPADHPLRRELRVLEMLLSSPLPGERG